MTALHICQPGRSGGTSIGQAGLGGKRRSTFTPSPRLISGEKPLGQPEDKDDRAHYAKTDRQERKQNRYWQPSG
jgi:hypothetical protein